MRADYNHGVAHRDPHIAFAFLAALAGLACGVAVGLALPLLLPDDAPVTPKFRLAAPAIGGTVGFIVGGGLAARSVDRRPRG